MPTLGDYVPIPSALTVVTLAAVWLGCYLVVLLALNLTPHISVKSIGWLTLHHVTIKFSTTKVTIGFARLKIFAAWSGDAPFRMFNVVLGNVEVITTGSEKKKELRPDLGQYGDIPTEIVLSMPSMLYNVLFVRKWLNEAAVHFHRFTYTHRQVNENISLSIDYFRVESFHALENGNHRFAITAIDGYVKNRSAGSKVPPVRVLHNLDLSVKYTILFWCPRDSKSRTMAHITNLSLLFSVSDLYIPRLDKLLAKRSEQAPKSESKSESKKNMPIPSLRTCLRLLNLISSVLVKVELGLAEYGEVRVESSSHSINFLKDTTYEKVVAKVSWYVTAGKMFHLDLRCLEIPSLTYLFETDLTDVYRACKADDDKYFIDLATSLAITNPAFDIYFDQLAYLLEFVHSKDNSKGSKAGPAKRKIPERKLKKLIEISKLFRKVSAKALVTDVKGTLHTPGIDHHEFHRGSLENVVTHAGISYVALKSSTRNFGRLVERKCVGGSTLLTIKSYLKLRNIRLEVGGNEVFASNLNTLIGYCVDTNSVALKIMTKKFQVRSVNTMIFQVIRRLQEARINHYNKACANIDCQNPDLLPEDINDKLVEEVFLDIFNILPPLFTSVRFRSTQFLVIIICNDALPSHIMYDENLDTKTDLASFKRGVSYALNDVSIDYKRTDKVFKTQIGQIQANTMSDHSSEYIADFDQVTESKLGEIDFNDVSSLDSRSEEVENNDDSANQVKRVMLIKDLTIENPKGASDRLRIHIPEIDSRIDIFLVWCVMYAHTLVNMISPKVKQQYSKEQVLQLQGVSKKIHLDVQIDSIAVVARLVHNVDVMVEFDQLSLDDVLVKPECQIRYSRLYVVHPNTQLWARMVSITDAYINLDTATASTFVLNSKSIRLNIPFQYLVYTVIDNVITFGKAIKQVKNNFRNITEGDEKFALIHPDAMNALKLPCVRWKTKTFGLTLENDPFETELAMIYELGAIEQIERGRKLAYFEQKEKEIRSQVREALSYKPVRNQKLLSRHDTRHSLKKTIMCEFTQPINGAFKNLGHHKESTPDLASSKLSDTKSSAESDSTKATTAGAQPSFETFNESPGLTEDMADRIISNARDSLHKDFERSWVNKFRKFRSSRFKQWEERSHQLWGKDEINPLISNKFDIQEYAPGALQFSGLFKDFDIMVKDPEIPDVDKFLHDYGKGQPKLDYSILVPIFLHIRSSMVYFGIKDYTIPLLSFPPNEEGTPVMDFLGNIVINEKLVHMKEEMRHIFVPFSPAVTSPSEHDNFYSAHIIRTLTPVKFMFDLRCNLKTERACIMSWSKSYLPAISATMGAFDNFTKPEIDDSPLGWWDKVALIAHGKLRFDVQNELCLHIKSSISPYDLIGESSGFVFCWKNDVSLRINDTGKKSEIVILESYDFILGIPNYSTAEKRTWSLFFNDVQDYLHDADQENRKFLKRVMKFSTDEKVCWKLGFLFERNVDKTATELSSNQKRTDSFKPHYDVRVTSPEFEWHPDSYEDYRSDYLHMAISVSSKSSKGNAYNAAYFTPMVFRYFFAWWNTISDTISLPIREGTLFARHAKDKSLVKMGPHLFTFTYQLDIQPLSISHMYLTSAEDASGPHVVRTGLKGKFAKCIIDLHQRKEVVRYVNDKLGIDKRIRKLKLNLGEIDLTDADIRFVHAAFADSSLRAQILASFSKNSDVSDDESSAGERENLRFGSDKWLRGISIEDDDFLWLDQDDFVELEEQDVLSANPVVDVKPFFFTPKFTYFREFSLEIPEGAYPFGREKSHDCLIGAHPPDEVQAMLLEKRAKELHQQYDENVKALKQLDDLNNPVFHKDYQRLKGEIAENEGRLNKVNSIFNDLKANSRPTSLLGPEPPTNAADTSEISSVSSLTKFRSRQGSTFSNFKCLESAEDVISSNASVSDYHNRFLLHNLQLKWNNQLRDLFIRYLQLMGEKKTSRFAMTRSAIDFVNNLVKQANLEQEGRRDSTKPNYLEEEVLNYFKEGSDDVIDGFDEYLERVEEGQEIEHKFLIKLIRPQVQMMSDADLTSCILETNQQVELRVIGVNLEGTKDIISEGSEEASLVDTRFGVFFQDSHFFAFQRDDFQEETDDFYLITSKKKTWPPWVDLEVCDDSSWLTEDLVLERTDMTLALKRPNMLLAETSNQQRSNELVINLSKLVLNATSSQYSAIYYVITDLLMHSKGVQDAFHERLDEMLAVTDISDFIGLAEKVQQLQTNIRLCRKLFLKMDQRGIVLSDRDYKDKVHIETELERMKLELELIISGLKSLSSTVTESQHFRRNWHIRANQVIWHLLEDNREPFVDLALATSQFTRVEQYDGSNLNEIEISMVQGFNLNPLAVYPELLRPLKEALDLIKVQQDNDFKEPILKMTWEMLNPVGGIRVMKNSRLNVQPIHIQLDYNCASKMFSYLFPKDDTAPELSKKQKKEHSEASINTDQVSINSSASSEVSLNPFRRLLAKRRKDRSPASSSIGISTSSSKQDESLDVSSNGSTATSSNGHTYGESHDSSRSRHSPSKKKKKKIDVDDLTTFRDRSAKYMVIGEFEVKRMKLCVSFKPPKHLNIIDVHNLNITIPTLRYKNKTWTGVDFANHLKRDIIKVVLSHSGKIIGNKFKKRDRKAASTPLKQISDYSEYMSLTDLEEEGRSRDDKHLPLRLGTGDSTHIRIPGIRVQPTPHKHRISRSYVDLDEVLDPLSEGSLAEDDSPASGLESKNGSEERGKVVS